MTYQAPSPNSAFLHLLCGKPAAGKSTLSEKLSAQAGTILIREDEWLHALFASEMVTLKDYVRCSEKLRAVMAPHVVELLRTGLSVVLDFPANTIENRNWMRSIIDQAKAAHKLHWLDTPDEICLKRLQARNAAGSHPFQATEAQFKQIVRHFEPPNEIEGFDLVIHTND